MSKIGLEGQPEPDNVWSAVGRIGGELARQLPLAELAQWLMMRSAQNGQTQVAAPGMAQIPPERQTPSDMVDAQAEGRQEAGQQIPPPDASQMAQMVPTPEQKLWLFIGRACAERADVKAVADEVSGFLAKHPALYELSDELLNVEPSEFLLRMSDAVAQLAQVAALPHAESWIRTLQAAMAADSAEEGDDAPNQAPAAVGT
jgi:hypothetical protein